MAESSSNSSTTSTSGAGSSTSTTGTTSTSNSGAAASGSQTSSNGSFSTGKSNGNFSGGLPGLGGQSWGSYTNSKGSETGAAHSSGVQGPGLANGNFGSKWGGGGQYGISPNLEGKHVLSPNAEGKYTLTLDGGDGKGNYSTNNAKYMTVDEVYGEGNQSMVVNQGDYEASSNEKSNIETSTFGKQDEISVTPVSITEDKGLVNNDAIQSVEGLDFQQKDKANQEVMEAKKSRDDAEAEDNANGMRNQLKAAAEKDAEEDNNTFQVGEETNSKEKAAFIEAEKAYKDIEAKVAEKEAELAKAEEEFNDLDNAWFEVHQPRLNAAKDALNDVIAAATRDNEENGKTDHRYDISYLAEVAANPEDYADAARVAEQLDVTPGLEGNKYLSEVKQCVEDVARVSKDFYEVSQKHEEAQQRYNQLTYELADLMGSKEKAEAAYNKAKESYDSNFITENPVNEKSKELPAWVKEVPLEEPEIAYNEAKEAEIAENPVNETPAGVEIAQLENEQENNASRLESIDNEADQLKESLDKEDADYQAKLANNKQLDAIGKKMQEFSNKYQVAMEDADFFGPEFLQNELDGIRSEIVSFSKQLGIDAPDMGRNEYDVNEVTEAFQSWAKNFAQEHFEGLKDFSPDSITAYKAGIDKAHLQRTQEISKSIDAMAAEAKTLEARQKELPGLIADAKKKSEEAPTVTEEAPTVTEEVTTEAKAEETPTTEAPAYQTKIEAARNEINNSKELTDEQKSETLSVLGNVESAADAMNDAANNLAANPNDNTAIETYFNATKQYNKALKDAKGDKTLKNTDFNKTFTEAVAAANDFDVTMPDGTTKSYAEFATEMAVKSPALAKGLYEAKAEHYADKAKALEDKGKKGIRSVAYKALAAIENKKAEMAMTWLGSKFTFADNQVRSQFNQMAKTDMRATYATYNNVLSDETGKYSEADKAEAFDAIQQANSLMVASAALQASTGFLSGIGDGTSDGVYGKTNPGSLNDYQKALNTASNFAKIALGLGVTPGANEAYQNMYYMAGAKVNQSGLYSKDFDSDGFALCQEYGNNAAVGMIAGAGELGAAVALMFNPATSKLGLNLAIDAVQTFFDALYGVQKEVNESIKYSSEVLNYFNEAKNIADETGNKEAIGTIDSAIKQIEDFQLKSDEVGNLDNWLEGSGSNTADNGKFNQALSYDEWLKLIEADPVMQEYAKSLNR